MWLQYVNKETGVYECIDDIQKELDTILEDVKKNFWARYELQEVKLDKNMCFNGQSIRINQHKYAQKT